MGDITALGYLGLTGSIQEWSHLAGLIGLQAAPPSSDSAARFRIDERAWRISRSRPASLASGISAGRSVAARPSPRPRQARRRRGLVNTDLELARLRSVVEVFSCQDPSGFCLEFFYGGEVSSAPFLSPSGARFVTSSGGRSLGLGHVVFFVDDIQATTEFYMALLGFELSDSIVSGIMGATFAHTNPRHHSLAFGAAVGPMKTGLPLHARSR